MKKESFGESLRRARIKNGLSQKQLADRLFVTRSTVANWETGRRVPDFTVISKLSDELGLDANYLLRSFENKKQNPTIIVIDDEKIILNGNISVLREVLPNAEIVGFFDPEEALCFALKNDVDLALLDIEMGQVSGLDVCKKLLSLSPNTNVIYLTAYRDYAYDAWNTGASGFILKPLTKTAIINKLQGLVQFDSEIGRII